MPVSQRFQPVQQLTTDGQGTGAVKRQAKGASTGRVGRRTTASALANRDENSGSAMSRGRKKELSSNSKFQRQFSNKMQRQWS